MTKTSPPRIFEPSRVAALWRRRRLAKRKNADFLAEAAASAVAERLAVTLRDFQTIVDISGPFGGMRDLLEALPNLASGQFPATGLTAEDLVNAHLSLEENSVDLVTSVFALHRCNDLVGALRQIRIALKPDGLLLAALPGDRTLHELRECLLTAEAELAGSASLRVDPFGEVRQYGALLQRSGFALPVVDSELFTVRYSVLADLVGDLRAMGATAAFCERAGFGPRLLFERAEEIYRERHCDPDGKIRATFEIVHLSGWAPAENQQKALRPGSADVSLADVLGKTGGTD